MPCVDCGRLTVFSSDNGSALCSRCAEKRGAEITGFALTHEDENEDGPISICTDCEPDGDDQR